MWVDTLWEDIPSSETVYGLPRPHWGSHLRTFDWSLSQDGQAKQEVVLEFMDAHEAGQCPHLLLLGKEGTGKTHLAVGLYRWAVYQEDLTHAQFIHVPEFSHRVKRGYESGDDPFEEVERARFLVLDDPFGRDPSEHELTQIIPRLIDMAYTHSMSLVVTANHDVDGFESRLRPHEMSRLLERADILGFFHDTDHRQST